MDIYSFLDEESKKSFEVIKEALKPYGARLFFAGGCVRDAMLGLAPKDFDIEVYGVSKDDFEAALCSIGAVGVGKSFFVYKYENFDISLPRSETKIGVGHTGFEVTLVQDMRTACTRRDFTVNAMLLGAESGELIDFFGGTNDLDAKILRIVSQNSFADDSLRVLRAMQFAARFDFKIERQTLEICRNIALDDISKSRIFTEFEKLFYGAYPIKGLYYFFKLGIAEKLFSISIDFRLFLRMARGFYKAYRYFGTPRDGLFLYILFLTLKINKNSFLDKIGAPNRYRKMFGIQKAVPQKLGNRFLVALSLKMPISMWLGAYKSGVEQNAKKLFIWSYGYRPNITHQKIIAMGYKNGDISKYYRQALLQEIRENF